MKPSQLTACGLMALLTGCATETAQQYVQRQDREDAARQQSSETLFDTLRARCTSFGFPPNSESFARCMQTEARLAEARADESRRVEAVRRAEADRRFQCLVSNNSAPGCRPPTTVCSRDALGTVRCVEK